VVSHHTQCWCIPDQHSCTGFLLSQQGSTHAKHSHACKIFFGGGPGGGWGSLLSLVSRTAPSRIMEGSGHLSAVDSYQSLALQSGCLVYWAGCTNACSDIHLHALIMNIAHATLFMMSLHKIPLIRVYYGEVTRPLHFSGGGCAGETKLFSYLGSTVNETWARSFQ
jgi:hypothetical protein